jgi:hypothetical protein
MYLGEIDHSEDFTQHFVGFVLIFGRIEGALDKSVIDLEVVDCDGDLAVHGLLFEKITNVKN